MLVIRQKWVQSRLLTFQPIFIASNNQHPQPVILRIATLQLHITTQGHSQSMQGRLLVLYVTKLRSSLSVVHLITHGYVMCMLFENVNKCIFTENKHFSFFLPNSHFLINLNLVLFPGQHGSVCFKRWFIFDIPIKTVDTV